MHWGTEGQACPDANQLALAPRLARAGADIIIGAARSYACLRICTGLSARPAS